MRFTACLREFVLTSLILTSGAAQAAYPTPGAQQMDFQVHPVSMVNAQDVVESFLSELPDGEYSIAADERTGSIIAVATPTIQKALASFIQRRTEERMKRFLVEMQISQATPHGNQVIGKPRLEVPFGKTATIHLDGKHQGEQVDWKSKLDVSPELDGSGRIRVRLNGGKTQGADVALTLIPGESILIDERLAKDENVRAFAKELNVGRSGTPYSFTLSIRPL